MQPALNFNYLALQLASNWQVKKNQLNEYIYSGMILIKFIHLLSELLFLYQSNIQAKYLNFFVKWLYMYYSAYVLACFQTLESDGDNAHWFPSLENWHFKWFFSRVKVKTMAFSRNPRPIQSTRNLRLTHHPWTYKYSINLETYIQMWVVNCRSSFDVGGFKSRFCFFLRS